MSTVRLYRQDGLPGKGGKFHLLVTYGQVQEFHNALPLLVGPYQEVVRFEMHGGTLPGTAFFDIVRKGVAPARYKVEGLS